MKIIHTADWHLGKNLEGHSRIKEQEAFLGDFVRICEEEQADLILIAGDVFDSYNPSALAEQLFYDTFINSHTVTPFFLSITGIRTKVQ